MFPKAVAQLHYRIRHQFKTFQIGYLLEDFATQNRNVILGQIQMSETLEWSQDVVIQKF